MGISVKTLYSEDILDFFFLQIIFESQGPEKGTFLFLVSL